MIREKNKVHQGIYTVISTESNMTKMAFQLHLKQLQTINLYGRMLTSQRMIQKIKAKLSRVQLRKKLTMMRRLLSGATGFVELIAATNLTARTWISISKTLSLPRLSTQRTTHTRKSVKRLQTKFKQYLSTQHRIRLISAAS